MSFGGQLPDLLQMKPLIKNTDPASGSSNATPAGSIPTTPTVPSAAPPNVSGGAASFSLDTGAIKDLVASKQAQLNASENALQANSVVDANANRQILSITDDTLKAYGNIQKAESLPGGSSGKLAHIWSLFDSDFNVGKQVTTVKMNEMKAASIAATAEAIKKQNNALPDILGKVSDAAQAIFTAQKEENQLAINYGSLQNEVNRTAVDKARLGIELTRERREQVGFNISKMSTAEVQQQLSLASQGKGAYKDAAGLLEHHLVSEQKASADLASAQIAASKGQREEMNASSIDFVSNIPVDFTKAKLAEAQKANSPTVDFTVGKNPDGTPKTFSVAVPLVQAGLIQSAKTEADANKALAADYTERLNIIPNATQIVNVGNAFARMNPQFAAVTQQTAAVMKGMDTNNPASVRQSGMILKDLKDKQTAMVKSTADQFGTPQAKAAIIDYGTNGKFTPTGGLSVVSDAAGIPSLASQSLYKDAWEQVQTLVATKLAQQGGSTATFDMSDPANTQQALAAMMQRPNGKEKINQITQEVLLDPSNRKAIAQKMGAVIQSNAINNVLHGMANQKNADPIWTDLYEHTEQVVTNGKFDPQKLGQKLIEAKIKSGGKIDYGNLFLQGFRNYTANSDNDPASNPAYTVYDHALDAGIYGENPNQAVLGGLHYQFRTGFAKASAEMQQRIQEDISGQTQQQAVEQSIGQTGFQEAFPGGTFTSLPQAFRDKKAMSKSGVDLATVPSATGTGLSVQQIIAMFPGG